MGSVVSVISDYWYVSAQVISKVEIIGMWQEEKWQMSITMLNSVIVYTCTCNAYACACAGVYAAFRCSGVTTLIYILAYRVQLLIKANRAPN